MPPRRARRCKNGFMIPCLFCRKTSRRRFTICFPTCLPSLLRPDIFPTFPCLVMNTLIIMLRLYTNLTDVYEDNAYYHSFSMIGCKCCHLIGWFSSNHDQMQILNLFLFKLILFFFVRIANS